MFDSDNFAATLQLTTWQPGYQITKTDSASSTIIRSQFEWQTLMISGNRFSPYDLSSFFKNSYKDKYVIQQVILMIVNFIVRLTATRNEEKYVRRSSRFAVIWMQKMGKAKTTSQKRTRIVSVLAPRLKKLVKESVLWSPLHTSSINALRWSG